MANEVNKKTDTKPATTGAKRGRKKKSLPQKKQEFFNKYGRDKDFMDWVYSKNEKTYPGFKYLKDKWPAEFENDYRYYLQAEVNKAVAVALDDAKDDFVDTGKYRTHSAMEDRIIDILKSAGPLRTSNMVDSHTFTYDELKDDADFVEGIGMVAFMYDAMGVESPHKFHPVHIMGMITTILKVVKS